MRQIKSRSFRGSVSIVLICAFFLQDISRVCPDAPRPACESNHNLQVWSKFADHFTGLDLYVSGKVREVQLYRHDLDAKRELLFLLPPEGLLPPDFDIHIVVRFDRKRVDGQRIIVPYFAYDNSDRTDSHPIFMREAEVDSPETSALGEPPVVEKSAAREITVATFRQLIEGGSDEEKLLDQLAGIESRAFGEAVLPVYRARRALEFAMHQEEIFIASETDGIKGLAHMSRSEQPRFVISDFAVLPERQNNGIGTALLDAMIEYWRAHGAGELVVHSELPETANSAYQFYTRYFASRGISVDQKVVHLRDIPGELIEFTIAGAPGTGKKQDVHETMAEQPDAAPGLLETDGRSSIQNTGNKARGLNYDGSVDNISGPVMGPMMIFMAAPVWIERVKKLAVWADRAVKYVLTGELILSIFSPEYRKARRSLEDAAAKGIKTYSELKPRAEKKLKKVKDRANLSSGVKGLQDELSGLMRELREAGLSAYPSPEDFTAAVDSVALEFPDNVRNLGKILINKFKKEGRTLITKLQKDAQKSADEQKKRDDAKASALADASEVVGEIRARFQTASSKSDLVELVEELDEIALILTGHEIPAESFGIDILRKEIEDRIAGYDDPASDVTIAGNGWKDNTRRGHELFHDNLGQEMRIIWDMLTKKAIEAGVDLAAFPPYRHHNGVSHFNVRNLALTLMDLTGRKIIFLDDAAGSRHVSIRILGKNSKSASKAGISKDDREDGIMVIKNNRFNVNHAGRNEMTVYAHDERGVVHEKEELILWRDHAMDPKNGIFPEGLGRYAGAAWVLDLGGYILEWLNKPDREKDLAQNRIKAEELRKRFHRAACRAELEYVMDVKREMGEISNKMSVLVIKKLTMPAIEYLMNNGMDIDIVNIGQDANDKDLFMVSPNENKLRISVKCLMVHSSQWIEHRVLTYVRYQRLLGRHERLEDRLAQEVAAENLAMMDMSRLFAAGQSGHTKPLPFDMEDDLKKYATYPGISWSLANTYRLFRVVKERFYEGLTDDLDKAALNSMTEDYLFYLVWHKYTPELALSIRDEITEPALDDDVIDQYIRSENAADNAGGIGVSAPADGELNKLLQAFRGKLKKTPYHSKEFDQNAFLDIINRIEEIESSEGIRSMEDNFTIGHEGVEYPIHPYRKGIDGAKDAVSLPDGIGMLKLAYEKQSEINGDRPVIIRVNGRSGSGKTYISELIKQKRALGIDPDEVLIISTDRFLTKVNDTPRVNIPEALSVINGRSKKIKVIVVEGVNSKELFGKGKLAPKEDIFVFRKTREERTRWQRIVARGKSQSNWAGPEYFLRSALVRNIDDRYGLDLEERDADIVIDSIRDDTREALPPKSGASEVSGKNEDAGPAGSSGAGTMRISDIEPPFDLKAVFGNDRPVIMEIGFQDGEMLLDDALKNRDKFNYVGVELEDEFNGKKISPELRGLPNVKLFCGSAKDILPLLKDGQLSEIRLIFPPPYLVEEGPVTDAEDIAVLAAKLEQGGTLRIVTEDIQYAGLLRSEVARAFGVSEKDIKINEHFYTGAELGTGLALEKSDFFNFMKRAMPFHVYEIKAVRSAAATRNTAPVEDVSQQETGTWHAPSEHLTGEQMGTASTRGLPRVIKWEDIPKHERQLKEVIDRHGGRAGFLVHSGGEYISDNEGRDIYLENIRRYFKHASGVVFSLGNKPGFYDDIQSGAVIVEIPSKRFFPIPDMGGEINPIEPRTWFKYWAPVTALLEGLGVQKLSPYGGEMAIFTSDDKIMTGYTNENGCCVGCAVNFLRQFDIEVYPQLCASHKPREPLSIFVGIDSGAYQITAAKNIGPADAFFAQDSVAAPVENADATGRSSEKQIVADAKDARRKILVLCEQNIERSPLAAAMLNAKMPDDLKNKIEIVSAGISETMFDGTTSMYTDGLPEFEGHVPRQVSDVEMRDAVKIFVMTTRQKEKLILLYPEATGKIELLVGEDLVPYTDEQLTPSRRMSSRQTPYWRLRSKISEKMDSIFAQIRASVDAAALRAKDGQPAEDERNDNRVEDESEAARSAFDKDFYGQENFTYRTFIVNNKNGERVNVTARLDPEWNSPIRVVLDKDGEDIGSFVCYLVTYAGQTSLAINTVRVNETYQRKNGSDRPFSYAGWRLIQAAVALSQKIESRGAINLRSSKKDDNAQKFYQTLDAANMPGHTGFKTDNDGAVVHRSLTALDAARFISDIDGMIDAKASALTANFDDVRAVNDVLGRDELIRPLLGDLKNKENLARLFKIALESYAVSGKKLVIAVQDGLGMEGCDMNVFLTAIEKWKREMLNDYPKMESVLNNLIVLKPFADAADLNVKLGDGLDRNDRENNFVFVFAKYDQSTNSAISSLGSAIRPSFIKEDGRSFTGYYYPLVEIVALSMLRELLGVPLSSILDDMKAGRADFPIESIADEAAYLIFTIIPKVEPYDPDEHVKRFAKVLQFLRSA